MVEKLIFGYTNLKLVKYYLLNLSFADKAFVTLIGADSFFKGNFAFFLYAASFLVCSAGKHRLYQKWNL